MTHSERTGMPSAETSDVVVVRRTVVASAQRAFAAWTNPAFVKQWACPPNYTIPVAEIDLRVGGGFRQHMIAPSGVERRVAGRYLEIDPPRRLVYTWRWEGAHDEGESQVTVEFHETNGRTDVTITHAMLPTVDSRRNHENGWNGCLVAYVNLVEEA